MHTDQHIDELIRRQTPGSSLQQAFYTDPSVFERDMERLFRRMWLFAGLSCEVREPGQYLTFDFANDSIIVIRDDDGELHALVNSCRHRGSRICSAPQGRAKKLVCPYHQWVYARDGRLQSARWMGDAFDGSAYRLKPLHAREAAGFVFVCMAPSPPPFEPAREAIEPQVAPHALEKTKICYEKTYHLNCNWKVLVENNRECYHCRTSHPEFCLSNYDLGVNQDTRSDAQWERQWSQQWQRWEAMGLQPAIVDFPGGSWFRVARLPLREGFQTESMDGELVAPLLGHLPHSGTGSLRIITLPNGWHHANCDYGVSFRLAPRGPLRTDVRVCYLVREDAVEGQDFHLGKLTAVWDATADEDWTLCENNQAGICTSGYEPGPYSPEVEGSVDQFVRWYLGHLQSPPAPAGVEPKTAEA